MRKISATCLFLFCLLSVGAAYAEPPAAPAVSLSVDGVYIAISWPAVDGADGYYIWYAPYPGAETVGKTDIGSLTTLAGDLSTGDAFYLAAQAYNTDGPGEISNIVHFDIPDDVAPIVGTWKIDNHDASYDITTIFQRQIYQDGAVSKEESATEFSIPYPFFSFNGTLTGSISNTPGESSISLDGDMIHFVEYGKATLSGEWVGPITRQVSGTADYEYILDAKVDDSQYATSFEGDHEIIFTNKTGDFERIDPLSGPSTGTRILEMKVEIGNR